jgi:acyl-[acyl-carrier-protein]-phospholipid O-acyltransferase/long-chain-fatty-acid--[acyl-carrier-protein] ligase
LILAKGANVFRGYLNAGLQGRFLEEGWFNTGDIGRFDEDGCLVIEGRLSRFSKIGGEMVSHANLEGELGKLYPEMEFFVGARECERKGEALVLLASGAVSLRELGSRLRARGIPNLWIPKEVVAVDALPVLGTGKLDLKRCKSLCARGPTPRVPSLVR